MSALAEVVEASPRALVEHAVADPGEGRFAASIADPVRRFTCEAVYEGYLLHYDTPRAFEGMDEDLRLLAGDTLYALGLDRVAAAGDLVAVAELSDLISGVAQACAEGDPGRAEALWTRSTERLS